jgi:hypothetical protein
MPDTSPNSADILENAATANIITEGYQPDLFVPEVTYVRQGDKVCFFLGESSQRDASLTLLNESCDGGVQLVESIDEMELVEVKLPNGQTTKLPKDGVWEVEGPYQRSDVFNANKRAYRRKLWEKQIGDSNSAQQRKVAARGMIGHLEHPSDGRTDGNKGAILTTSLKLQQDGVVWGKSEILDTPGGWILQEYTRKKVRWGVSSRGSGTVGDDGYVNEDYALDTFDAVMTPSTPGSYPTPVKKGAPKDESTVDSPDVPELTEDATVLISEVEAMANISLDELDESSLHETVSKLWDQRGRANSLVRSNALSGKQAHDLQDWLDKKLREAHELTEPSVSDEVSQIIDEATADVDTDEGREFRRVIEGLQQRVSDVMADAESANQQLESLNESLVEVTQERDDAREQLETINYELESVTAQLEIATGVIQDHSTTEVENPVEEAVAAAIAEAPVLEQHRTILEGAETPERVEELAVEFIAAAGSSRSNGSAPQNSAAPKPVSRRALPSGEVISEAAAGSSRAGKNPSRGASLAGKAIASAAKKN